MRPRARQWVRWLFNVGWILLLVLPPVTCKATEGPDWLFQSLVLAFVGTALLVLVTSIIGLFDHERRAVSLLGLLVVGGSMAFVLLLAAAAADLTASAFKEHGMVEQLLGGLAHVR
jgi:hypothetical protein